MKLVATLFALLISAASVSAFAAKSVTKPGIGTQPINIGTQPAPK
jgi:hypothetical protein